MNRPADHDRSTDKSEERRRARQRLLTGSPSDSTATERPPADMSGAASSPVEPVDKRTRTDRVPSER